jgi:hypothetical protein
MSTTLNYASTLPKASDASGNVEGTIGEHVFETHAGTVILHEGSVLLTLIDRHDDGSAEEIYIRFSDNATPDQHLSLENQRTQEAWISFKTPTAPFAIQCTNATLHIETLVLIPLEVKGTLKGETDDPDYPVAIAFHMTA